MRKKLISYFIFLSIGVSSSFVFANNQNVSEENKIFKINPIPIKDKNSLDIQTFEVNSKPIPSSDKKLISKEISNLKNNTKDFFSEINREINSPTIEINGEIIEKDKIKTLNDGKIILTPIKEDKDVVIPLPKSLEEIKSTVEWEDYEKYKNKNEELRKNKSEKESKINRPDGFYSKENPADYIDDFFDNNIVDQKEDKKNIKEGLEQILNNYNGGSNKKSESIQKQITSESSSLNKSNIKEDKKTDEELKNVENKKLFVGSKNNTLLNKENKVLDQGFSNIMDLYSNPDRKETLGFISNDLINSTPKAIRKHAIPENLKGKPVYIRIFKEENSLELYLFDHGKYKLANTYNICTYSGGLGPKKKQGDEKSPEGFYSFKPSSFKPSSFNPYSQYHKSIDLGFPNAYDKAHGYSGSLLMVHGGCKSIGCYAMTDDYIDEIYSFSNEALKNGQIEIQVDVFPFKMNNSNMEKYAKNENIAFWQQIKKGYDLFEKTGKPPKVSVRNKEYVFH